MEQNFQEKGQHFLLLAMDQNLGNFMSSGSKADMQIPTEQTKNGEKSKKCSQCNYASVHASALRAHLKTHSGEKSNKCNQCDHASSIAGNLRRHLKTHSGEKSNK